MSTPIQKPAPLIPDGALKFEVRNSMVILQPWAPPKPAPGAPTSSIKSLQIDLKAGTARIVGENLLPEDAPVVLGVAGLLKMEHGAVLILITKAKKVCVLDHPIWKVQATQLVTHEAIKSTFKETRTALLLQEAFDIQKYGAHMYFSYKDNLTQSAQRQSDQSARTSSSNSQAKPPSLWEQADKRFTWNCALAKPVLDGGAEEYALPIMVGYIGQLPQVKLNIPDQAAGEAVESTGSETRLQACITVIGRLAASRAGARWWRCGLDEEGNAAHTEELEVRLAVQNSPPEDTPVGGPAPDSNDSSAKDEDSSAQAKESSAKGTGEGQKSEKDDSKPVPNLATFSHVQVRSSSPALWSRLPNVFVPYPHVNTSPDIAVHAKAFTSYMDRMIQVYKGVTLLHVGSTSLGEDVLEKVQHTLAEQYSHDKMRDIPVLSATQGRGSLSEVASPSGRKHVWSTAKGSLEQHGMFYMKEKLISSRQSGIICTTGVEVCDALDVVQASLAEGVLEQMLATQGLLSEGQSLETKYPTILQAFRTLCANHATVVGDQINGLGSLGSGSIRNGDSPSILQILSHLWLGCERQYHSVFLDAQKQDAISLLTGQYAYSSTSSPLVRRKNGYTWLHVGLIFGAWSLFQTAGFLMKTSILPPDMFVYVGLPAIASVIMLGYVVYLGSDYLEHPQLCKELINPRVARPASAQ